MIKYKGKSYKTWAEIWQDFYGPRNKKIRRKLVRQLEQFRKEAK